jgi:maltose alpha-D-glucosyltransferase/alpha-amylase
MKSFGPALEAARLLGSRTAEMHMALATPTSDPAFSAEPLTPEDLAGDARQIDDQIASTLEALRVKLSTLKDLIADEAALLLSRRIELFARANAITASTAAGQRIRIHGDYHLGQILRTGGSSIDSPIESRTESGTEPGDFVILDFRGRTGPAPR